MTKKKESFDLFDYCETVTTITCTKCEKEDTLSDDNVDAIQCFFDDGWRGTRSHCYCPDCADKYLKKK